MNEISAYVDQYYSERHTAPSVSEIAKGVGIAKTTSYRYLVAMNDLGMSVKEQRRPKRYAAQKRTKKRKQYAADVRSSEFRYRNIHPKLIWGRTKTIGRGDKCCNFLLQYRD